MSTPRLLRVGWHREHFLSPLLQLVAEDAGKSLQLVECPGGTGDMQVKLKNGEIDVCIALTDALIAGLANGKTDYKLVGRYISSSLRWAITTGKDSKYTEVDQLKGTTFGISRLGSGSQVMASVLSLQQGWGPDEQPKFQVNGQFKPLRDSVNAGDTSVFLWEWFTTKPYVDSGEVRFIGSVYTPWPCWSIAAAPAANKEAVKTFLSKLQPHVIDFDSEASRAGPAIDFVEKTFGQQRTDVEEWLKTVKWEHRLAEVSEAVVRKTLGVLQEAGVVPKEGQQWDMATFVDTDVAKIVESADQIN
ncbi:hypothetical protein CcaverHIS002_0204200 [Cutaneotrichosporon cavernicola]|uniref:Ca3427-like PBP 2 domain-containing protein n=1 Tax=Cutaneotrichosporon cavernicola TaxID=279322 RepID=A0AA48IDK2_9TREE|nr:uncharacterized protein CcaverHIS019_0204180 [Cutaneotrichosporon cavernicola]BEI81260.1 hypothetical protein CcaverHIS002_0204200 [Cutaneotrichosporon cavernicola]BEI89056.1 hypothetical protein CcaverHIS019_0204180 [Cutaneotrichosporon cavernicola]BEI96831.1 hypothetical protein CcaverHIS631_0204200 [Cutaneotrichosporon cavernicola]BEJ04603.1 hypothetical protein CcaverHIS641_0204200 [Cutaneotrichosporon cavernicola]